MGRLVGDEIRMRREALGMSQRELARRTDMSSGGISLIERGETNPHTDSLIKIAAVLELPPEHLLRLAARQGAEITIDPRAQTIAEQVSALSPNLRNIALDSMAALASGITRIAEENEEMSLSQAIAKVRDALGPEVMRGILATEEIDLSPQDTSPEQG